MDEKQVLDSVHRAGWQVTSRYNKPGRQVQAVDAKGEPIPGKFDTLPSDVWVWTIANPNDPNAQPDQVEVQVTGEGKIGTGYTVIKPPSNSLPTPRATPTPASQLEIIKDPTSGKPIKLRDPATGTVIGLPDTPAGSRPSVVQGPKDSLYAWDGQSLTPLLPPSPDKPDKPQIIQGQRGALYSWDGQNLNTVKPGEAPERQVVVVDNQLIDKNTGAVVYTAPQGVKFQTAQDGTILAIDPANPTNVQVVWQPKKVPELVPGQSTNQQQLLTRDPATGELVAVPNPIAGEAQPTTVTGQTGPYILQQMPDGTYRRVPNPAYVPAFQQALQDHLDSISQIEQQVASGGMTIADANRYKQLLQQKLDATLQGTTPYQVEQDRQTKIQNQTLTARDLLNQRVASGTSLAGSLLNGAINIVSNKNFMDPSAIAGFSPFSGAMKYVTDLGGGQGVYDAASQAVQKGLQSGTDPASALLNAALNAPAQPQQPAQQPDQGLPQVASQLPGDQIPDNRPAYNYQPETSAQSIERNQAALAAQQYGQPNVLPTGIMLPTGVGPTAGLLRTALRYTA